ncbi:MAG TPA: dihydrolipoamide acetyltransferase family protein [Terriglobia bacterium]|nr:dihydrolipoamide acetyltransferase family protein [Terriglobia bacterium]
MPTNVIMPQMGESIAEGTVTKWLKKVGDRVERDEALLEISTDKVDAEIPSPSAGVLTKILVAENQTVAVNAIVAEIDGEGSGAAAGGPEPVRPQSAAPSVPPASAPPTLPISADSRAAIATPSPVPAPDGDTRPTSQPASQAPATPQASPAAQAGRELGAAGIGGNGHKVRSSPLVRRIAKENQVDLRSVTGTGLGGRISKKDILDYLAAGPAATQAAGEARPKPAVLPQPDTWQAPGPQQPAPAPVSPLTFSGATQAVPMTPMRKQIAEHMILSRRTSAHVTTVFEVEMTRVYQMRAQNAAEFERRNGQRLTFTSFFVRAAVEAIKQYPIFNASVDGDNVIYKRDVNIGIAVALETGLIVPVVKHADEKNFLGVARAVTDLAERARTKRLNFDEVQGGTFTITNPGVFGSLFGTPIINQPQVAILGVGVIEKRAVVRNDAIAIRPMAYLALSFDHRVIDGAMADQFLVKVKTVLENWSEAVL